MNPRQGWNIIVDRIITTAPTDIGERRDVLEALVAIMPRSHSKRSGIVDSFSALNTHVVRHREILPGSVAPTGSARLSDQPIAR